MTTLYDEMIDFLGKQLSQLIVRQNSDFLTTSFANTTSATTPDHVKEQLRAFFASLEAQDPQPSFESWLMETTGSPYPLIAKAICLTWPEVYPRNPKELYEILETEETEILDFELDVSQFQFSYLTRIFD